VRLATFDELLRLPSVDQREVSICVRIFLTVA
jgi:hypothetical protein